MDAILNFVKDFSLNAVMGGGTGSHPVPEPDISLVGSFIFDDDSVACFDDDSQILK